jgi:uncharacterized paraquat-inducible protein A
MKWSWKGPLALVGLIVLGYFAFMFVATIAIMVQGHIGPLEAILIISTIVFPLALFVASGFVAAKVEERIRRRKAKLDLGGDQMRTCASCGKQAPKGAHFCPYCGRRLEFLEP